MITDDKSDNADFPIPDEVIDRKEEAPPTLPPIQKTDNDDNSGDKDKKLQDVVKELGGLDLENFIIIIFRRIFTIF